MGPGDHRIIPIQAVPIQDFHQLQEQDERILSVANLDFESIKSFIFDPNTTEGQICITLEGIRQRVNKLPSGF